MATIEAFFLEVSLVGHHSFKKEIIFSEFPLDTAPTQVDGLQHNNWDFGKYRANSEKETEKFSNIVWCGSGLGCSDHVWDMQ